MEKESSLEELKQIRNLMERSSISHSLSGLSGVAAGIIGILFYFGTYAIIDPMLEKNPEWKFTPEGESYLIRFFSLASAICLTLVFAAVLFFNYLRARRT